jgi:HEAT repeats/HEAT repeat
MRALLALVALIGLGLGGAREYWSPNRIWRRAVRSADKARQDEGWRQANAGLIDGLSPEQTRDELIAATGDGDPMVRFLALRWLRFEGKTPSGLLPLYVQLLKDPYFRVRYLAAEAVGEAVRMSLNGRDLAEPALLATLDDPDPTTRQQVLHALGQVVWMSGRARDPLLEVVAARLEDPDEHVWLEAAYVLARSGTGREAVPKLMAYMIADRARNGGRDPGGTGTADNVLARLAGRSPEVLPFLLREVYRPGQGLSNRFLFALQWVDGPVRQRAVDLSLKALDGGDDDLRVGAALFLEGPHHASAIRPAWLRMLHHPDPEVRRCAINALRNLDRLVRSTRDAIRSVRDNDRDPEVRQAAADALWLPPGFPDPDAKP